MNSAAPRKFKFLAGDHVRLSLQKHLFEKGYKMNWTEEIFQITRQLSRTLAVYTVQDLLETLIKVHSVKKSSKRLNDLTFLELKKYYRNVQRTNRWNILRVGLVTSLILIAGFSHQILNPSQRMNENSQ